MTDTQRSARLSHDRRSVHTPAAPAAIGPYVQAVAASGFLFASGALALDPADGRLVGSTPAEQAEQALRNLSAVVEAGGASLADVVRATIYMTDLGAFADVNEVYARFFGDDPPARVTIGVAALPLGAQVEIDAIAALG